MTTASASEVRPNPVGGPFRLLLIDSRPLTRSYLADSLRMALKGSVTDIADAQEIHGLASSGSHFEAVILNLGDEAFDAATLHGMTAPVRSHFPDCCMLLLSSRTDQGSTIAALGQGVQAYLMTDRRLDATLDAIRFACSGWVVYPNAMLLHLKSVLQDLPATAATSIEPDDLTPRQTEVLHCLAAGMSNRDVASHLDISQSTVKAHVKAIMLRFRAANRTQAVALLRSKQSRDHDRIDDGGARAAGAPD
jgi:DNA-binding NarL/FixJ family response regulator